ncbi:MAG TPA: 2-oxoglutarate dehydrogenase complex dihydrolipoyllysine-residue succinyltransferase [Gemmatimonadaceae bacterium]|nr:2-oxoglutarate dehydrogenase complex dihydrolipoyllysine-residue succinyltransferase [Gemmatimonadaceae bacterium]
MIAIKVPPLGESIVEATISRWLKQEGQAVAAGETLVELETDKITVEVPALKAGVLTKQAKHEGDVVTVDEVLGELDETATAGAGAGAAAPAAAAAVGAAGAGATGAPPQQHAATATAGASHPTTAASTAAPHAAATTETDVKASPAARRLAAEQGVELASINGTGRGGVVSKPDVIEQTRGGAQPAAAPAAPTPAPAPAPRPAPVAAGDGTRETREKMSTRRRRIAENLLQAQHATAHLTTFNEIDMTAVSTLRKRLKEHVEKEHGVRLSFMPFFIKAACQALKAFPMVNAQLDGDSIVYKHYVNMGIAVASDQGLVVPNIKDADRKGMLELSRDMDEVAKRARAGKLTMDDLTGGTFTITNGGVFGSLVSTPIINYPQVAILGLHKIQDRPVAIDGRVEVRPMMYVALSYDHRIIDGQQAVLFLVRVKELMEDPGFMLVE